MTLLEMTQTILEKMDSDEVNSIEDTVESIAVAREIRDTYRYITDHSEDYQKEGYGQLEGIGDRDFFNQLKIPENFVRVDEVWFNYDLTGSIPSSSGYAGDHGRSIHGQCERHCPEYLPPKEFVEYLYRSCDHSACMVKAKGTQGPFFPINTNCDPRYFTTFDEDVLFFSSVDLTFRETLHASETAIVGMMSPEFKIEDSFTPDLHADEFSYFLNEAIDACFVHFKGVSNSKAQKRARDQKVMKQNNRERIRTRQFEDARPPYGRYSRGGPIQNPYGRRNTDTTGLQRFSVLRNNRRR